MSRTYHPCLSARGRLLWERPSRSLTRSCSCPTCNAHRCCLCDAHRRTCGRRCSQSTAAGRAAQASKADGVWLGRVQGGCPAHGAAPPRAADGMPHRLESRTSRLRARPQPTRHSAPGRPATHTCEPLGQHVSYVLSVGLVQTAVYSCLPYLKDSGVLTQRQISRMLTVGTACFVVGKLSTAQILDQVVRR